jgi:hypothetical protein
MRWFDPRLDRSEMKRYPRWKRRASGKIIYRAGNYTWVYKPIPVLWRLGFYTLERLVYQ